MESLLAQLGITSGGGLLLFFIMQKMINHNVNELKTKNAEIIRLTDEATQHRKEERDLQIKHMKEAHDKDMEALNRKIESLEKTIEKSKEKHDEWEKRVCDKIDSSVKSLYERFNPMIDILNTLKGYMEGEKKNAKGL
jgi:chromosome segregation ATPase